MASDRNRRPICKSQTLPAITTMSLPEIRPLHVGLVVVLYASGCSFGPAKLRSTRTAYNVAVQRSTNEELLLNLVRLRYREPTLFLGVSIISSSFNYQVGADTSGSWSRGGGRLLGLGGSMRYSDSPTTPYTPLQGEKFTKQILAETDPYTFALLHRAGWSLDRLLRIMVERLGSLQNDPSPPGAGGEPAPVERFCAFATRLQELQNQGKLRLRIGQGENRKLLGGIPRTSVDAKEVIDAEKAGYEIDTDRQDESKLELRRAGPVSLVLEAELADKDLRELLGDAVPLPPTGTDGGARNRTLVLITDRVCKEPSAEDGELSGDSLTVPVLFRSFNDMLFYLAQRVSVPEVDLRRGVIKTREGPDGAEIDRYYWGEMKPLLKVHTRDYPPDAAFVAIRYRGHWYYIDDRDITSKDTFALLSQISALQAGDVESRQPILTVPVSGR